MWDLRERAENSSESVHSRTNAQNHQVRLQNMRQTVQSHWQTGTSHPKTSSGVGIGQRRCLPTQLIRGHSRVERFQQLLRRLRRVLQHGRRTAEPHGTESSPHRRVEISERRGEEIDRLSVLWRNVRVALSAQNTHDQAHGSETVYL